MNKPLNHELEISSPSMLVQISSAEIDQQVATAHRYPRSIQLFRDEAYAMVTLNEQIADECIYAVPREGKTIEGPSARFAEIIVSAWGNSRSAARVVDEGRDFITAQGVFFDLQKNVATAYEVRRSIVNKKGVRYSLDMIGVTGNAACSIALRNAVLKGIPKPLWNELYLAARKVVMGDFKTLANRRADALKAFQQIGVNAKQIATLLGIQGADDIQLDHLVTLRGTLTAIKEGDTTVEQVFPPERVVAPSPDEQEKRAQQAEGEGQRQASDALAGAQSEAKPAAEHAEAQATEKAKPKARKKQASSDPQPDLVSGAQPAEAKQEPQVARIDDPDKWLDGLKKRFRDCTTVEQADEIFTKDIEPNQAALMPPDYDDAVAMHMACIERVKASEAKPDHA